MHRGHHCVLECVMEPSEKKRSRVAAAGQQTAVYVVPLCTAPACLYRCELTSSLNRPSKVRSRAAERTAGWSASTKGPSSSTMSGCCSAVGVGEEVEQVQDVSKPVAAHTSSTPAQQILRHPSIRAHTHTHVDNPTHTQGDNNPPAQQLFQRLVPPSSSPHPYTITYTALLETFQNQKDHNPPAQ